MTKTVNLATAGQIATDNGTITPVAAESGPYSSAANSALYRSLQWYRDGFHVDVDAISTQYSGTGVVIGLVDEGFDLSHPDLAGRFDLGLSYDPRDTGAISILPDSSASVHGTWVAGVLGARANDEFGLTGIASGATLAGYYMRFGSGGSGRAEVADLLSRQKNVDVSNNSWGYATQFADNFQSESWSDVADALRTAVVEGRDGAGTVFVFAAGNDRQYVANSSNDGDNTNYHSLTNTRFGITVAASTQDGHIASFSTPGASILVTAPGDAIITTALNNGDSDPNDFVFANGTSFAAPIVSGVAALMLEANPALGYRDVQEILAISARTIDATSSGWSANGATNWNGGGHKVSHDFGFGLVDAHAAVRLAETWTLHHDASNETVISFVGSVDANTPLVDFEPQYYTTTVSGAYENFSIDWIEVDIRLQHTHLGDLKIYLVGPTGTLSVLLDRPSAGTNATDNLNFTFTTNHNWGESPVGNWTLTVEDAGNGGIGSMLSYALRFFGDDEGLNDTYFYTDDFVALDGARSLLVDASGVDTINAAAVTYDVSLNLVAGSNSSIGGRAFSIDANSLIENAFGGDGNDTILGNASDNRLNGGRGNDVLSGGEGADLLEGAGGDDLLVGGAGADVLDGGVGRDTVSYAASASAVQVNLATHAAAGGDAAGDTLAGIENLVGSAFNDILTGDAGANILDGGLGADVLAGNAGADRFVFDSMTQDRITDYHGSEGDIIELAGLVASSSITGQPTSSLVRVVADTKHAVSYLQVDVNGAMGGRNFVTIAQLDGVRAGDTVKVMLDSALGPVSVKATSDRGTSNDFNGDGYGDILWQNVDGTPAIWLMNGTSLVSGGSVALNPGPQWQVVGSGDFDGDGRSDILWQNKDGTAAVWSMDGTQIISGASLPFNPGSSWKVADAGDFDGDGRDDILWQNENGSAAVWFMNGTSLLAGTNVGFNPGPSWKIKDSGDFNGDGKADVLWQNDDGTPAVWLMDGGNILAGSNVGFNPGPNWKEKGTGDFNGDGCDDILWQHDNGQVAIWMMDGTEVLYGGDAGFNPTAAWKVIGTSDFNGDGKSDILWQNVDGTPAVWLMNGLEIISGSNVGPFNPGAAWHVAADHHNLI